MTTLGRGHTIGLDYMSTLPQDIFQPEYTFAEVIVCMLMYVSVSTAFSVLFGGHKHRNPVHAVHCSVEHVRGLRPAAKIHPLQILCTILYVYCVH